MQRQARRAGWAVGAVGVVVVGTSMLRGEVAGLAYPNVGVSLAGPAGWVGRFVAGKHVVARWDRVDPEAGNVRAAIEVRATPARGASLETLASNVAKAFGGVVTDDAAVVDGVRARWVDADREERGRRVRGAVVLEHRGVCYTVIGAGILAEPWKDAVREVLSRWKWVAIESPARAWRYVPDVHAAFAKGLFRMPLPVGMGLPDGGGNWNEADGPVTLDLCNYLTGQDEFQVTVEVRERPAAESMEDVRRRLGQELSHHAGLTKVDWSQDEEGRTRWTTAFMQVGKDTREQWGVVEVDDKRVIVVRFRVQTAGTDDQVFYQRQAAYMFRELNVARV